jgi:hypothetical protein
MGQITVTDHKRFVDDFVKEYLADGLGAITKREIDILVMNLLMEYAGLARKSNHELSILLQVPESRLKRLRYEARLKYPPDADYVKREFLFILARSQFELDRRDETDIDKMKIKFAMEDDFLRYAIQGRLKDQGMFADTSFNNEIVKIECSSLVQIIADIYGEQTARDFREGFATLDTSGEEEPGSSFKEVMGKFILDTGKSILSAVLLAELKQWTGI